MVGRSGRHFAEKIMRLEQEQSGTDQFELSSLERHLCMAEIVNLRKARKAKARAEKETQAAENRIKFGRSKAERDLGTTSRRLAERKLEAHRRETDADE